MRKIIYFLFITIAASCLGKDAIEYASFLNNAIYSLKSPISIKYSRKIEDGGLTKPQDQENPKYIPEASGEFISKGNGVKAYKIERDYPKDADPSLERNPFYIIEGNKIITFSPNRGIAEISNVSDEEIVDPFFFEYLVGIPTKSVTGYPQALSDIFSKSLKENAASIEKGENGEIQMRLRFFKQDMKGGNIKAFYLYTLFLEEISGIYYPKKASLAYLLQESDSGESQTPAEFEISYEDYRPAGIAAFLPWRVTVTRYILLPPNKEGSPNIARQYKVAREILEIQSVNTDIDKIKKEESFTIPESTRIFDKETGDAFDVGDIMMRLSKEIKSKQ